MVPGLSAIAASVVVGLVLAWNREDQSRPRTHIESGVFSHAPFNAWLMWGCSAGFFAGNLVFLYLRFFDFGPPGDPVALWAEIGLHLMLLGGGLGSLLLGFRYNCEIFKFTRDGIFVDGFRKETRFLN